MGKIIKRIIMIVAIVLAAVITIVGGYAIYLFASYHRLGDMTLEAKGTAAKAEVSLDTEYKIASFNMGFGAYEADYGFFMDGGNKSWAWSKERLDKNLKNIAETLKNMNADIYNIQEVDISGTRTYNVDQIPYLTEKLTDKAYVFAQNFDSPFLMYPVFEPHGANKSGIMTFSSFTVTGASRVELPVETGITKIVDLDRCYSKTVIAAEGGKSLVVYNFHLSAYTTDGTIAVEQLKKLLADVKGEYEKGNYCIAAGDFNKDLLGDSSKYFGKGDKDYNWAQPIPDGTFDGYDMVSIIAPLDTENPIPTCRNADSAYHKGQFVVTIDGFMVTNNVEAFDAEVIDTGFAYSDHNPIEMKFRLI